MKLTEVRVEVREEDADELARALRVLFERSWPEAVVRIRQEGRPMTDKAKAAAFDRLRAAAEENRKVVRQYDYRYITWVSLCKWMDAFLADAEKEG